MRRPDIRGIADVRLDPVNHAFVIDGARTVRVAATDSDGREQESQEAPHVTVCV